MPANTRLVVTVLRCLWLVVSKYSGYVMLLQLDIHVEVWHI